MNRKLDHVSFTLTSEEIKALNRYRKENKDEVEFEVKISPSTDSFVMLRVRVKGTDVWENITDIWTPV